MCLHKAVKWYNLNEEEVKGMDGRTNIDITSKLIVERLKMFLDEKTKSYAKIYLEISMNNILEESTSYEDFKIFANTIDICKEFAKKNNISELLNYCTLWNKMGVEKYKTLNNSKQIQTDNDQLRYIQYQLQNFYDILIKPMKDIDLISRIIPQLKEYQGIIKNSKIKTNEFETKQKILGTIDEQLEMAYSIMSISDELDENLKIR